MCWFNTRKKTPFNIEYAREEGVEVVVRKLLQIKYHSSKQTKVFSRGHKPARALVPLAPAEAKVCK